MSERVRLKYITVVLPTIYKVEIYITVDFKHRAETLKHSRQMEVKLCFHALYRTAFRSDLKKTPIYIRTFYIGTLFSEELLQRRDVVSLNFSKLFIPYRIRQCFSRAATE
jgi:hypothetical protein